MWTVYRNGITPKKKKKKKKEAVSFPPISSSPFKPPAQDQKTRLTTSQRLQELFFSQTLSDYGPLDRTIKNKKTSGHQVVSYAKLSVETDLEITAHLKNNLQQHHFKLLQDSSAGEKEAELLNFLRSKTFQLKDQALKALFNVSGPLNSRDDAPQLLQILKENEKEEEEENVEENNQDRKILPALSSCTDEAPDRGSSEGTCAGSEAEKKESLFSKQYDEINQDLLDYIKTNNMQEDTDRLCHIKQRRFMIYLCGGYLDTVAERSALMERVYPQLYLYCKQRGYDFRMVDLRRGVTDPISDYNDSAELHIELLKKCQETEGPSFFMFTGQKHEVQSLPTTISQGDFEAILRTVTRDRKKQSKRESEVDDVTVKSQSSLGISNDGSFTLEHRPGEEEEHTGSSALMSENSKSLSSFSDGEKTEADNDQDLGLLQTWYQLDENTVPPVYRLLPVSTHLPDFLSRDGQRRKAAKKAWRSTCLHIWGVLQCNGPEAIGETATSHLLRTVLDWEMEQGLGAKLPAEEYSHCYKRIITDLLYNLRSEYAQQFIDLHKGRPEINQTLHRSQQSFIHNIHSKLRHTNIYETNVSWGRKGLSPKHNRSHQFYTERLCSHFQRIVTTALNRVMQVKPVKRSFDVRRREASRTRLHEEMQLHLRHGKSLAQSFEFRQNFLLEVKDSLEISASSQNALLLLGEPGSGKSTLMAKVVQLLPTWISGKVKVLVCFVGLASDSRNVRLLLQMICTQMADIYCKHTEISESLPQLIRELHSLLMLVSEDRPLALVLDGLDELSEEHEADLSWLYTPPPPHVYILLSASKESSAYQVLKSHAKVSLLSLPPLSSEEITAGLRSRLASDARRLQTAQWNLLLQRCLSCPNPLYLSTAYSLSLSWSSFTPPEQTTLPGQLQSLFQGIFASLERKHGEHLLRRAASLLCLSRCGVTEEELLRLLGRDERVAQEIAKLHNQTQTTSGYDSVPFVLWARLRHDIGYHLTQVESDGTWVLHWTHSEFGQVATQRYLKTEDTTRAVHADFAEYYGADGPDSSIFQPLAWSREEGGKRSYVFNLRKLHGLPYHLIRSGQILPLFSQCIFNYEFLLHKLWGLSFCHIEEDLKAAIIPDKDLVDKDMLVQALCLSRSVLLKDPCQLASQLLGRLLHITTQDKPVAPGDPLRYTYLHTLMAQCQRSTLPVLVPSYSCLMPPGGLTHTLLTGHLSPVTALAFGQDHAVSCSVDGTLKLWKLDDTVALARTLPRSEGFTSGWAADSLTLCLKDSVLVLRKGHRLQVREVDSGKVFYTESESLDVPVVTSTGEGRLLVVFYDGSHKVKVFDLAASCSLLRCVNVTLESEPIHKDNSILLSHNSIKDHVFFAYRSGGEAAVFSANSGTVLSVVKAQEQAASIQAVEMSSQYLLLFCRYPYKRDTEIIHIELYCPASFQYLRSILGCSQDYISQVTINRGGTHVIAFCPSNRTVSTEIITWNLETEDHKHMARFPGLLTAGICPDLRFCLGFCSGERYLRLWNLISRINDQTLTYNIHRVQRDGTQEIIPMDKYPSYVVCRGIRTGTVRVWNVSRAHFRGRPVRVEHSLFSSSDVVLAQDLKLYILTDRGTATFTDTPTPVYQTLLVYDLLTRSYVKRQSGLFIVPCPQQDYRLLRGELLLGLSENRDHLIVWDLDSGYIKGRIKTYHKESLLTSSPLKDQQSQTVLTGERKGLMMPWDWRTESHTAKKRRQQFEERREKEEQRNLEREKHNSIDQYLLSGDEKVVICSYFAHHLNVFSVDSQEHLHTLEDRWSLLGLCTAALTHSGGHLAISNYSEVQRSPYLTLWDTQHGRVQKRLKNEPGICCVAITNDASRIAFGIMKSNKLKVWEPFRRKHKTISGYRGLKLDVSSQLYVTEGGTKAILLADELSVWDLDAGTVLSVFTPDSRIQCVSVLGDENCTLHLGFSDTPTLISMTLSKQGLTAASKDKRQDRVFGESSSSEEEDEPEVKRVK